MRAMMPCFITPHITLISADISLIFGYALLPLSALATKILITLPPISAADGFDIHAPLLSFDLPPRFTMPYFSPPCHLRRHDAAYTGTAVSEAVSAACHARYTNVVYA